MSNGARPRSRLALAAVPIGLFAVVTAATVVLAVEHVAQPGVPQAAAGAGAAVKLGDAYRGETLFGQTCAGCHGDLGKGGGIGPKLAGAGIGIELVKQRIDAGRGVMPGGLVSGRDEEDVLAFVASLIEAPAAPSG